MSTNYTFRFYNSRPMFERTRVVSLLQDFVSLGGRVTGYESGAHWQQLPASTAFEAASAVSPEGYCIVELVFARAGGSMAVLFQAHAREAKGAQVTFSIEDEVFEAAPDDGAALMQDLAQMVGRWLTVRFGWGDNELVLQYLEPFLRFDRVAALAWANLFGKRMMGLAEVGLLSSRPTHQLVSWEQGLLFKLVARPGQRIPPGLHSYLRASFPGCVLPPT